ncbi:MAG: 2-oxoacid:acceptor oxidoreductase subunit alpha [Candidatus Paceibacterota bacterium]
MKKEYSVIIGGAAGQGSRKAGLIIAKLFNKLGYGIYIYEDYQSLIRGGHNFSQVTAAEGGSVNKKEKIDFLLALDKKTIERHKDKLKKGGVIFFNSDRIQEQGIGIAADKIVKELNGLPIMANIALIAGLAKGIGITWDVLEKILKEELGKEIEKNLSVAKKAYTEVLPPAGGTKIEKTKYAPGILMTGNEAIALGLKTAGLDIYFAYPMTPASSILHYLAARQKELGVLAVQSENEIAVASEAIGAAYAGKRSAVGTSGGGFALMTETVSLAAQAEIPFMAINSQRMGPATGVPTYGAQSDLLFTLNPGHGDFEKFIAAPSNAEESFYWSGKLLNLAWKYQTPAILLTDKDVSEGTFSIDKDIFKSVKKEKELIWSGKGEYQRYKITQSGLSPLAYPGTKNAVVKANSYEHIEAGISEEVDKQAIEAMQNKRLAKFALMQKEADAIGAVKIFGNKKSKTVVVAWGSTAVAAREAAEKLGIKMVQPILISPFPLKQMKKALNGASKIICAETNSTGQMATVLAGHGFKVDKKILKYDAQLFSTEELARLIKN